MSFSRAASRRGSFSSIGSSGAHIRPASLNRKASIATAALNLPDGASGSQTKDGSQILVEFDEIPGPPDGGWGWVICFACFLGNFTGDGIAYTFGVLIKPLSEYFEAPFSSVSLIGSVTGTMAFVLGPLTSSLINRFGSRIVCIAGGLLTGTGFALSLLSQNVSHMIALYGFIAGSGLGLMYVPTIISVNYYFDKKRSIANGLSLSGSCVGGLILAPALNLVVQTYGWKIAMLVLTALSSFIVLEGALLRPLELVLTESEEEDIDQTQPAKIEVAPNLVRQGSFVGSMLSDNNTLSVYHGSSRLSLRPARKNSMAIVNPMDINDSFLQSSSSKFQDQHDDNVEKLDSEDPDSIMGTIVNALNIKWFVNPIFLLMVAKVFLSTMGEYIPHCYLPYYACSIPQGLDPETGETVYLTSTQGAFLVSLVNIGNMVGRILMGAVVDLPWVSSMVVFNATTLATAACMIAFLFVSTYWSFACLSVMYGFSMSCVSSQISVVLAELFGIDALASTFGLVCFFRGAAFSVAWPLGGVVYEVFGSRKAIFLLGSAELFLSGCIGIAMHLMHRLKNRKNPDQKYQEN